MQNAWVSMDPWSRHAWWNRYLATICLHDDESHLNIHNAIDLHNVIEDRTIVVVIKILLRISIEWDRREKEKIETTAKTMNLNILIIIIIWNAQKHDCIDDDDDDFQWMQ